jgi:hypothetical protein
LPFLPEATADFFNEYLWGKQFILYMDHKPLEKLGHLYSKMLNRLQTALLEHDFVLQYKKGSNMLALSRLPGAKETLANISAFDPFQAGLFDLQMQYDDFQMLMTFMTKNEWPPNLSRQDRIYFKNLAEKAFQDTTHQLTPGQPSRNRKEAMCEAHSRGPQYNSQNVS